MSCSKSAQEIIFLDQPLDASRLRIATEYGITVISLVSGVFTVQNREVAPLELVLVFAEK